MDTSALSSTYRLYKEDTNSIAAWLASTAKSLGFSGELSCEAPSATPTGGGRLKGKARLEAKKAAAATTTTTTTKKKPEKPAGPKYIIRIKDFVPLAEYVAGKLKKVSKTVGSTLDRVIAARSAAGSHYGDADTGHEYFIKVLHKVREVLKPLLPGDADKKASEDSGQVPGLAEYGPAQESLDAPPIERPGPAQGDGAVYEAEVDPSLQHALFALTVVINDMNRIRSQIDWVWSNYKIGVFDVSAAAIATNTAIDLVRDMTEDIVSVLDQHGGIGSMLQKFHIMQLLAKGWTEEEIIVGLEGNDNFNYETYDEGTYFTTFRLLQGFLEVLDPNHLPLYKEGMFGTYDTASDRSSKSGFQKFEDDRALLMPFFSEMVTALRGGPDWPVKDEFLRGMDELSRTRKIPFYLVFAAQVFLDITYKLGPDIDRPYNTLFSHTAVMNDDIGEHFNFHANLKIRTWPAMNDELMKDLQRGIKWIKTDPLFEVQARMYKRLGEEVPEREGHRIFRMSPVLSGLFLYHFRSRYRNAGLAVADAWGSIQYCEHLYNALVHERLLTKRWPDLDIVTTNLGEESFFVGGEVPKTLADYTKKFCLQMGVSVAAMAKGRRKNTKLDSKAGPRGIKEGSPVLSSFRARYARNNSQVDFTRDYVNQIIDLSLFEQEGSEEDGTLMMGQIEDPAKIREKKKKHWEQKNRKPNATKNVNVPIWLLTKHLVFALQAETLEYVFPYLSMHRWCWRVLRKVKDACHSVLSELYGPAYMEKESQLPFVVGWIFIVASGMGGVPPDRRLLELAATAVNEFLDTDWPSVVVKEILLKKFRMPVEFALAT
ncbi:hypothetical protein GGS20DRAFT_572080 [Poronia punctata]|nr:hypothetical protein GGS20DRAFT_572080 [Poronia punctata]